MSSATETLCGQAFGARQYHMMGIYLQRSWIVSLGATTVLIPTFIFATPIFRLVGEKDSIAREAGTVALWLIPIMYSTVFSSTMQMYLQAQHRNTIIIWFSVGSFLLDVLLAWAFVYRLGLALAGAFSAMIISCWLLVVMEFVYVFGGWCPDTWKGFTLEAFSSLWPVIKLSVSSGIMIWYLSNDHLSDSKFFWLIFSAISTLKKFPFSSFTFESLELWYNSVLVLLAGYMKNAEVAISSFSIW